jgi:hypothetical protein
MVFEVGETHGGERAGDFRTHNRDRLIRGCVCAAAFPEQAFQLADVA